VEEILILCNSHISLVSSTPILYEISQMSDIIRVQHLHGILSRSHEYIKLDDTLVLRAKELARIGFKNLDSLHIACAERAQAVFLTADDGIINTMNRSNDMKGIIIANPITWLEEVIKKL
jgi:predicted nucleic acid-binding protein